MGRSRHRTQRRARRVAGPAGARSPTLDGVGRLPAPRQLRKRLSPNSTSTTNRTRKQLSQTTETQDATRNPGSLLAEPCLRAA
ncbi:hypothetical protein PsYK624_128600 [Phanerochaete sordida]|uniref:Uncharacterized protein n=1 Tax=Phanerochaete sordida TaxID=48140 RepID=A0A9P3GLY4_9APHY|nr:hypothetical protein PsYK624_128600 [Phanerochaete sordida]